MMEEKKIYQAGNSCGVSLPYVKVVNVVMNHWNKTMDV